MVSTKEKKGSKSIKKQFKDKLKISYITMTRPFIRLTNMLINPQYIGLIKTNPNSRCKNRDTIL